MIRGTTFLFVICDQIYRSGDDTLDVSSLDVSFRKRTLQLVALSRKETCNLRRPMHLAVLYHMTSFVMRLMVSLAKEPYKRDDILQKRPIILHHMIIHDETYGLFSKRAL